MKTKIELLHSAHQNEEGVLTASKFIALNKKMRDRECFVSSQIILGFFPHLYGYIRKNFRCTGEFSIHNGHPYLNFIYHDQCFTFLFIGYGAPLAGMLLDESIALGGEDFIFLGPAGSLLSYLNKGSICVPTSAIRAEGTSFHYEEANRYSFPDNELVAYIQNTLSIKQVEFHAGRTWTTDAIYRETPGKIRSALDDQAITVDMEASALFSIASHYQKQIAGLFYITDCITPESFCIPPKNKNHPRMSVNQLFNLSLDLLHDFGYSHSIVEK